MRYDGRRWVAVAALALAAGRAAANGCTAAGDGWKAPAIHPAAAEVAPKVDGVLDDACWKAATRLDGFSVLDRAIAPPKETVAYVCADGKALYFAVVCRDPTPSDIRARETRRDGDIWDDDRISIAIDPWDTHGETFGFYVTARGTQLDSVPGGSAAKIEWRGDWRAASTRNADGWQAEVAIPYEILRYPRGQDQFAFSINRRMSAERLEVIYPAMGGTSFNSRRTAHLTGLSLPPQKSRPLFMPYTVIDPEATTGGKADSGLDVQYRLQNGLIALGSVNPDFKQIEDAVEPISFSYTERYLPERRPFFTTGQGYLPGDMMLYTRRIADFDTGAKLYGTMGKESVGVLDAVKYGSENTFATNWGHQLNPDSSAAFKLVAHQKRGEHDNVVWGLDRWGTRHVPAGNDDRWANVRVSNTADGPNGVYGEVGMFHWRGDGKLQWDWQARVATQGFRPDLGYFFDQNCAGANLNFSKERHYDKGAYEVRGWWLGANLYPYLDGRGDRRHAFMGNHWWDWRSGIHTDLGFDMAQEYGRDSSGINGSIAWSHHDMHHSGRISATRGRRGGGNYSYVSVNQNTRPFKALSASVGVEYTRLAPPSVDADESYQAVFTTSYDVTAEQSFSARLITRGSGVNLFAAYRQVVRKGTDMYVLIGDPDPQHNGFASRIALKAMQVF